MSGPAIPAECSTLGVIVNLARWLVYYERLSEDAALYLAENILGISGDADPHGIRSAARIALHEALQ
jgi:hypothetical protein